MQKKFNLDLTEWVPFEETVEETFSMIGLTSMDDPEVLQERLLAGVVFGWTESQAKLESASSKAKKIRMKATVTIDIEEVDG